MEITVNGQTIKLDEPMTIAQLLQRFGIEPVRVAVEKNRDIVPRKTYAQAAISPGDAIEIVTFVGGG
ncbi:MAG: sulfur carrier protein ThiS [Phycisphaerae bacterium]